MFVQHVLHFGLHVICIESWPLQPRLKITSSFKVNHSGIFSKAELENVLSMFPSCVHADIIPVLCISTSKQVLSTLLLA